MREMQNVRTHTSSTHSTSFQPFSPLPFLDHWLHIGSIRNQIYEGYEGGTSSVSWWWWRTKWWRLTKELCNCFTMLSFSDEPIQKQNYSNSFSQSLVWSFHSVSYSRKLFVPRIGQRSGYCDRKHLENRWCLSGHLHMGDDHENHSYGILHASSFIFARFMEYCKYYSFANKLINIYYTCRWISV